MIASAMAEIDVGQVNPDLIPDMIQMGAQICQQRKGILKEKEHFKQALLGTVRHARDILIKKGTYFLNCMEKIKCHNLVTFPFHLKKVCSALIF